MKIKLIIVLFLFFSGKISDSRSIQPGENNRIDEVLLKEKVTKISIMYPYAEGNTFNMEYYENNHMPMVAGYLGENLIKYTIEKGLASGIPDAPMPFMAIGSFYVKDIQAYSEAIGPNINTIRSDFANYTNVQPVILISEVIR